MADANTLDEILSRVRTVSTDAQLKLIGREVSRRALQLEAERAATFERNSEVTYRSGTGSISGVVQRAEGSRVLVKLAHGFVARIAPEKLVRRPKGRAR